MYYYKYLFHGKFFISAPVVLISFLLLPLTSKTFAAPNNSDSVDVEDSSDEDAPTPARAPAPMRTRRRVRASAQPSEGPSPRFRKQKQTINQEAIEWQVVEADGSYRCPECPAIHSKAYEALHHLQTEHHGLRFVCAHCDGTTFPKYYTQRHSLATHLHKMHPDLYPTAKIVKARAHNTDLVDCINKGLRHASYNN